MLRAAIVGRLGVLSSKIITRLWERRYGTVATSINVVDKGVNVSWGENSGDEFRKDFFHGIWLRHNCQCPLCYNTHSDQYIVQADELPNVRVTQAEVNGIVKLLVCIFYSLAWPDPFAQGVID